MSDDTAVTATPFTMIGSDTAAACVGDACVLPQQDRATDHDDAPPPTA